jgi:hypothetical protein
VDYGEYREERQKRRLEKIDVTLMQQLGQGQRVSISI